MNISFHGPRLQQFGGFKETPLHKQVKEKITEILTDYKKNEPKIRLLTSLELGIPTWAADIASQLQIAYEVFIPFKDPHQKWFGDTKRNYLYLVKNAKKKHQLDDGEYSSAKIKDCVQKILAESNIIYSAFPLPSNPVHNYAKENDIQIVSILPETKSDHPDSYYIEM